MSQYTAPQRDMLFALNELAGLRNIQKLGAFADATQDVVEAVLDEASKLASDVLAPLNHSGDKTGSRVENRAVITPPGFGDAYRAFAQGGWSALPFDTEHGGQGLPELVSTAVNEIWQSANMAFALCPMLTEGTVVAMLHHASAALKDKYLPKLISGEWTGTMNLTEPQAGSDLAAVKTRAEPQGDHYLLKGQKIFITWGDQDFSENIIHMVLARLPDAPPGIRGISLFLVPKFLVNDDGSPGARNDVWPVSVEHKMGIHASPTCVMSYGDKEGAVGYLIGKPNDGISCMFTMMNHARVAVGIQGLSISERAYQQARAYALQRVQGAVPGTPGRVAIVKHPDVRRMLMLMKAGTEAMRGLCYLTAASLDWMQHGSEEQRKAHTDRFSLLTPVVKAWCTELAQEITSLGVQVHGGMGYIEETGAAQHFRDARITTIYEGTTGIQANDLVGRKVLRDNAAAITVLIGEIDATRESLDEARIKGTGPLADNLRAATDQLRNATTWMLDMSRRDPLLPGAVSFNFLMLMGTVCGGWMMARAALAAAELSKSAPNDDFVRAKLVTARFYAEHILPRAGGYLSGVLAGSESTMALDENLL